MKNKTCPHNSLDLPNFQITKKQCLNCQIAGVSRGELMKRLVLGVGKMIWLIVQALDRGTRVL